MNEELRAAIRALVRHAIKAENDDGLITAIRIVNAYVEHGPLPKPTDKGYIPLARQPIMPAKPEDIQMKPVRWKPKKK